MRLRRLAMAIVVSLLWSAPGARRPAFAWGDEGHEVIGLIAKQSLDAGVLAKIDQILAGDQTGLTATDMASETTWADKYRVSDRNSTKRHYNMTHQWHFVDLELEGPDLMSACFERPPLPAGTEASYGPARACVVDKIKEFTAEIGDPSTAAPERCRALQFLLHFMGDIHQPLHASDDHDHGGNLKHASGGGLPANNLHHEWDSEFIKRLGPGAPAIAQTLIARISAADRTRWSKGTPEDWAMESYEIGKRHTYGRLPPPASDGHYTLTAAYINDATQVVANQLSKAGVRLAVVLNRSLK